MSKYVVSLSCGSVAGVHRNQVSCKLYLPSYLMWDSREHGTYRQITFIKINPFKNKMWERRQCHCPTLIAKKGYKSAKIWISVQKVWLLENTWNFLRALIYLNIWCWEFGRPPSGVCSSVTNINNTASPIPFTDTIFCLLTLVYFLS